MHLINVEIIRIETYKWFGALITGNGVVPSSPVQLSRDFDSLQFVEKLHAVWELSPALPPLPPFLAAPPIDGRRTDPAAYLRNRNARKSTGQYYFLKNVIHIILTRSVQWLRERHLSTWRHVWFGADGSSGPVQYGDAILNLENLNMLEPSDMSDYSVSSSVSEWSSTTDDYDAGEEVELTDAEVTNNSNPIPGYDSTEMAEELDFAEKYGQKVFDTYPANELISDMKQIPGGRRIVNEMLDGYSSSSSGDFDVDQVFRDALSERMNDGGNTGDLRDWEAQQELVEPEAKYMPDASELKSRTTAMSDTMNNSRPIPSLTDEKTESKLPVSMRPNSDSILRDGDYFNGEWSPYEPPEDLVENVTYWDPRLQREIELPPRPPDGEFDRWKLYRYDREGWLNLRASERDSVPMYVDPDSEFWDQLDFKGRVIPSERDMDAWEAEVGPSIEDGDSWWEGGVFGSSGVLGRVGAAVRNGENVSEVVQAMGVEYAMDMVVAYAILGKGEEIIDSVEELVHHIRFGKDGPNTARPTHAKVVEDRLPLPPFMDAVPVYPSEPQKDQEDPNDTDTTTTGSWWEWMYGDAYTPTTQTTEINDSDMGYDEIKLLEHYADNAYARVSALVASIRALPPDVRATQMTVDGRTMTGDEWISQIANALAMYAPGTWAPRASYLMGESSAETYSMALNEKATGFNQLADQMAAELAALNVGSTGTNANDTTSPTAKSTKSRRTANALVLAGTVAVILYALARQPSSNKKQKKRKR